MKNTLLFSALILALGMTSCGNAQQSEAPGQKQERAQVRNIGQNEAVPMLNDSSVVVIDVRTAGEVSDGFIEGADMFLDVSNGDFQSALATLDPNKKYLLYCRSGGRSSRAAGMMINAGFKDVYNLNGGIGSWSGPVKNQ